MNFPSLSSGLLAASALLFNSCAPRALRVGDSAQELKSVKDNWWEFFQRENPETATSLGEYKYNDKLSNYSPSHIPQVRNEAAALLARLRAIPAKGLSETDQLDHALLIDTCLLYTSDAADE